MVISNVRKYTIWKFDVTFLNRVNNNVSTLLKLVIVFPSFLLEICVFPINFYIIFQDSCHLDCNVTFFNAKEIITVCSAFCQPDSFDGLTTATLTCIAAIETMQRILRYLLASDASLIEAFLNLTMLYGVRK